MKRILLLFVMAISGLIAYSQTPTKTETMADFQATDNFGNNCYYKITDAAKHYVQLWGKEKRVVWTYPTNSSTNYEGNASTFFNTGKKGGLPASVVNPNNGETYYVKSVGNLASSNLRMRFDDLDTVVISEGIEDFVDPQAMMWCGGKVLVLPSTLRSGFQTFRENWNTKAIIGLEKTKLTRISDEFFTQCISLTNEIYLPPTVTYIGYHSMNFPSTQHKLIFPASVDSISARFIDRNGTQFKVIRSENPIPPTVFISSSWGTVSSNVWHFLDDSRYNTVGGVVPDSIYVPIDATAAYEAKQGWSSYIHKFYEEVKIGSTGYRTYYLQNENFVVPTGCTAYVITGTTPSGNIANPDQANVVAYAAGKIIPKQTGFILKGAVNSSIVYSADATGTEETIPTNFLVGTATEQEFSGTGYKYYVLANGDQGLGFYKQGSRNGASMKIGAHQAGLRLPESIARGAKSFIVDFDGAREATEAAGISTVAPNAKPNADVIYDLQGRRVVNPTHGIYIINGKKVIK